MILSFRFWQSVRTHAHQGTGRKCLRHSKHIQIAPIDDLRYGARHFNPLMIVDWHASDLYQFQMLVDAIDDSRLSVMAVGAVLPLIKVQAGIARGIRKPSRLLRWTRFAMEHAIFQADHACVLA